VILRNVTRRLFDQSLEKNWMLRSALFALFFVCPFVGSAATSTKTPLAESKESEDKKEKGEEEISPDDFVRVMNDDQKWWFVHHGKRLLSKGVNVVEEAEPSPRDAANCYNVKPKFEDKPEEWAHHTRDRLHSWKFNTAAAWCDEILYQEPIYHTRVIWFGGYGGPHDQRLIDVFSPTYQATFDAMAQDQVRPHKNNPWLIGYFINNELPWYGDAAWPTSPNVSILTRYMELPSNAPGKRAVVDFLKQFYHDKWDDFTTEWQTHSRDFPSLIFETHLQPRLTRAMIPAFEWAGEIADRYFKMCSDAIRAYDPYHLILGSRFSMEAPAAVLKACARHSDVISVNQYSQSGHIDSDRLRRIYAITQRPMLITEFSWRAQENRSHLKNTTGAEVTVETQIERAHACDTYLGELLQEPYIVGYHWFQYHDEPPAGRYFDGEDSNFGLVDIYDEPYEELVHAFIEGNRQAEKTHRRTKVPLPADNPGAIIDYRPIRVQTLEEGKTFTPVDYLDYLSKVDPYGDGKGSSVQIQMFEKMGRKFTFDAGSGWGAGVIIHPPHKYLKNSTSADFRGARRLILEGRATKGALFHIELLESGADTVGKQFYEGEKEADGELFSSLDVLGTGDWKTYNFDLESLDVNSNYGNIRGNRIVDTQAIREVHLVFPADQPLTSMEVRSIRFE